MPSLKRVLRYWPAAVFLLYSSLFFVTRIHLPTSDLGRHITNGRIFLESGQVFTTNFYSYTHPEFPVVTHHWFFGIIAYTLHTIGGFPALTLANVGLSVLALGLVTGLALQRSNQLSAVIAGLLALPLVASRTEVRPETISFLGVALVLFCVHSLSRKRLSLFQVVSLLVPYQILWTNTHIFFPFAPFLIGMYATESAVKKNWVLYKQLIGVGVLVSIASCLNANGLAGITAPLTIFQEYGYQIAENQTTFFMLQRLPTPLHVYVLVFLGMLCTALALRLTSTRRSLPLADLLVAVVFAALALRLNRMYSFFGLVSIPLLATLLSAIWQNRRVQFGRIWKQTWAPPLISLCAFGVVTAALASSLYVPELHRFGIGLQPGSNDAAQFFQAQSLPGPVFNNYDIGGYLIYHLFPQERVFTDNRPEAYPVAHFREYIDAQLSTERWQALQQEHQFQTIFFYRHDLTNWGQEFLIARVQDSEWAPVYVDGDAILFVRRTPENQSIIAEFAIPKSAFGM